MALTTTIFQGSVVLSICFSVFRFFFQAMAGQSQGTKEHAAMALEAIFQKTVACKNFYQCFLGSVIAREEIVPIFLLHLECLTVTGS